MEWNNFFRIFTVGNPGWGICFNYNNTYKNNPWNRININTGVNYSEVNEENEWFSAKKDEYLFDASSGPLYLSVSLDIFRCFIEEEVPNITSLTEKRAELITNNPLLCWFEEFYIACCDEDWERMYGCSLVSLRRGWLMLISLDELYYEDVEFKPVTIKEHEGIIECYRVKSRFIIRTHKRGLITGIQIFKDWIDSQPEYPVKRKDYWD
jgi:hypothetical protein